MLNVLKSEINAESVLNRLYSAMSKLSYMAESYHLYPNEPWNSKGVHYFSVGNYSIFYVAENNVATVIHVSYGRRDLDKVLANYK
nr:type II toxin-antitoxin system RelE/ParE family toxin [Treponema zioleckii]